MQEASSVKISVSRMEFREYLTFSSCYVTDNVKKAETSNMPDSKMKKFSTYKR